ncbi:AGE family epimerase/isomerase [Saccharicrinis fermentans]|uniref:Cellobiose 2-epimerase n=1 Tax=Saccharicrinis fermentans DSM 9555 = JCM 21142 TaxID=869213 RepID=W7Y6E8_9BACT|nr:AGE family epimerase/isomerase [Saccharicrinis fermentans]GAF03777.1 putative sugar isomerase YihS [Saccharicrinis fermentans DSM 9555 = JCM 21142]
MIDHFKNKVAPDMKKELRSILKYWAENTIDFANEGFVGELDAYGHRNVKADKSAVLNTRLLYTFSAAYIFFKESVYLKIAEKAYGYLLRYFWDYKNGGLFWSVDAKGVVTDNHKQAYAQGFGIYGFTEYYKATGCKESLECAIGLFQLLEFKFKDKEFGGYMEALSNDWLPLEDMRLSSKDANEPKSMNTHLHIIEPYTELYKVWPRKRLKNSIEDLLFIFKDKIVDGNTFHFNLFFERDWSVKSNIVSYGHDIEGAWLLNEAAQVIQDQEMMVQVRELSLKIANATMLDGLDEDGSVFYEMQGNCLDKDKHWWPQAEALVGFLDAYQNFSDEKYLKAVEKVWVFILYYMRDKEYGEWFWKVDEEGVPDRLLPKVGFWKCPYHNARALWKPLDALV